MIHLDDSDELLLFVSRYGAVGGIMHQLCCPLVLVAEKPLVVFVCDARIEIDRPAPVVFIHPSYLRTAAMASFGNGTVWSPLISTVQCNR